MRHAAAVFLLAAVTFLPALSNGPIGDDSILLEQRLDGAHAPGVLSLVQQDYWGDLHQSGTYRPLSLATLFVERQAFGFDLRPYRAINLLLHAICSVLVLLFLRRLASARAALAGALLFAVHPIHAEAVTTIYGQADLWCALFFLGALIAVRWPDRPSFGPVTLLTFGGLYLLSLLSKEQGVLLPVLLFLGGLQDDGLVRQTQRRRMRGTLLAAFVPLLVYGALRWHALGDDFLPRADASVASNYPWWARINLILVTTGSYLRLLVAPWGQTTYYGHLRDAIFGIPVVDLTAVVLAALSIRPLQRLIGGRIVTLSVVLIAITLLPIVNVVPIGLVVGERCLYLPSVGVCALAAGAYARVEATRGKLATAGVCVLVAIGVLLSVRVASRWHTPLRHWETTVADHPRSAGAHARFALVLLQDVVDRSEGTDDPRVLRAENELNEALEINPSIPEGWEGRGLLALVRRDCAAAAAAFERAASFRPASPAFNRLLAQRCAT